MFNLRFERTKKEGINKVRTDDGYQKTMDSLERKAKRDIEKILDRKIKDTTENVLEQVRLNTKLSSLKRTAGTIDTFKDRIASLLRGI